MREEERKRGKRKMAEKRELICLYYLLVCLYYFNELYVKIETEIFDELYNEMIK